MSTDSKNTSLMAAVRAPMLVGVATIALFAGAFGVWGSTARISQAVVASGVINPSAPKHVVQHLEGGTVADLAVEDGAEVEPGQLLLRLDVSELDAKLQETRTELIRHLAEKARLLAERDSRAQLVYSSSLTEMSLGSENDLILEREQERFAANRTETLKAGKLLSQRVHGLKTTIQSVDERIHAHQNEAKIVDVRLAVAKKLRKQGFSSRAEVQTLLQTQARARAQVEEVRSTLASRKNDLRQAELNLEKHQTETRKRVLDRLAEVEAGAARLAAQIAVLKLRRKRSVVFAPARGRIVNLAIRTPGTIITPNQTIMEIVPRLNEAMVDIRVQPADIEQVKPGATAQVILSAFPQRTIPKITGAIVSVSADRLETKSSAPPYYSAKLRLDPEALKRASDALDGGMELVPGMPAEAMISTGENTMLGYLLDPLSTTLRRAFSED